MLSLLLWESFWLPASILIAFIAIIKYFFGNIDETIFIWVFILFLVGRPIVKNAVDKE